MQAGQQLRRIPSLQADNLPRLPPPAGYVLVIQDVDYGNRFKIGHVQQVDRDAVRRVAALSIEIRLALIVEAENAAAAALALQDQFVGQGSVGEWFDLDDEQIGRLDEIGRPQAMSLRRLALNDMGADSLVRDAKIVRSVPESPFAHLQRREKRPARRWLAWLILLLIIVLGAVVAKEAPVIRREIARIIDGLPSNAKATSAAPASAGATAAGRATGSPTAVPGLGEVFFVRQRARARSCANTGCNTGEILDVGSRIVALRYETGQTVEGDDIWIKFAKGEALLYVHRSVLTRRAPAAASTKIPTTVPTRAATTAPTAMPTGSSTTVPTDVPTTPPTIAMTKERALPSTAKPTATDTVPPTIVATATDIATVTDTPAPTSTYTEIATEVEVEIYLVETVNDLNARVRACASTNCEIVGRLRPGDAVQLIERVVGQTVNGSEIWVKFDFQGEAAFIHSSLLTEARQ